MELLELAIYVLFPAALGVFAVGAAYRLLRYAFVYRSGFYVRRPRGIGHIIKGLIMTFLNPIILAFRGNAVEAFSGLIALHLVALHPLVFLLAQHIAYIQQIIPPYGILWPLAIPISAITGALQVTTPTGVVQRVTTIWGSLTSALNGDILAIMATIGIVYKMVEKFVEKARGHRRVRTGDLLVWPLLLLIVLTGWLAAHHYPAGVWWYRILLGLHITSAAAFVAVVPFTKYFHFLWSYWYGKLHEWYDNVIKRGV
jgi:uncharacterized membrane protein